jgi:hypothetical protein
METDIVKGGQGRSDSAVFDDGATLGWIVLTVLFVVIAWTLR